MTTDNGSEPLRALWQQQADTAFSMELAEIQRRFSRLQGRLRRRKVIVYAICLGETAWFAYWLIFTSLPVVMRIGCLLIILGMNFLAGQVWLENRDRQRALEDSGAAGRTDCIDYYRTELVRRRQFHRGAWFWSRLLALLPGLLLIGGWSATRFHGTGNGDAGVMILIAAPIIAVAAIWLNYRLSRNHQREIDAIDAMKQVNGIDHVMRD